MSEQVNAEVDVLLVGVAGEGHRFADADATALALDYSLADQAATTGATNVDVSPVGDQARALALSYPEGGEVTVYAQQSTLLIRVTATTMGGEVKSIAVGLARGVVSSAGSGAAGTADVRTDAGRAGAAAPGGCDLVDLYPGYPEYQGYVTGVDGVGDHACLHDLEVRDPFFSRVDEDKANKAAGRKLGLDGDVDTWTWENWLGVEAERGMTPTCYACLIATADQRPEPRDTPVQRDDPRLLLGEFGAHTVYSRYAAENGIAFGTGSGMGDYQLRAMVGLANPGKHLNATELLNEYERLLDARFSPGQFLDTGSLCSTLSNQGGYFPIPDNAAPEDQLFAVLIGFQAFELQVPPEYFRSYMDRLVSLARGWQDEIARGDRRGVG